MAGRLEGKVAIVTGAGSRGEGMGNGKAASILFAREGAKVLCVDNVLDRAEATAAQIAAEGGTASAFEADVTKQADCKAMVAAAVARYGKVDILHNNVGIPSSESLEQLTEEGWDEQMTVNVRSMAFAAQAAVPEMTKTGGGAILNISSIAGVRAYNARATAYTVSKAAVIGLTLALAGQLGNRRIRVNCIAPGQVFTPLVARRLDEQGRQVRATSGLIKDEGNAWDIGWAAVYLASDEARWVTGQTLLVDAGLSITVPTIEYG
ncbi:MAG TPA: SDR family oxidoreductase [Dehalococcoidia bacterium]|nr:SDR family oxidoreductase [Dehalococcoidia bacterium]